MPQRRRASRAAEKIPLSINDQNVLKSAVDVLSTDPQLRGAAGNGAWRLRISTLHNLLDYLSQLEQDTLAHITNADGAPECKEKQPANWPLLSGSSDLQEVLKLTALAVRWPGFGAWLPLNPLLSGAPPGSAHAHAAQAYMASREPFAAADGEARANCDPRAAAALARQELVSKLRHVALSTMRLLVNVMRAAPLELSCHLACALLRMHTLQACSRSTAQAVNSPKKAQAADRHTPGPAAAAGAVATATGARGASSAVSVGGPSEHLLHTVRVSGLVLQGIASIASRLPWKGDREGVEGGTVDGAKHGGDAARVEGSGSGSSSSNGGGAAAGQGGGGRAAGSTGTASLWHTELVALLREALPGSGLVEHLARGVLHLMHSFDGSCRDDIADTYTTFIRSYTDLGSFLERSGELRAVCGLALGGPCASYLATAGGLQLLCTADAGPSYGMLSSWEEAGVLRCWAGEAQDEDSTKRGGAGGSTPGAAALPLTSMLYALLYKQPRRRVLTKVFERAGRAALASARRAATTSADGAGASGSGTSGAGGARQLLAPPGLQLSHVDAGCLAQLALRLMYLHLRTQRAADQLVPWRRWWRLACALVPGAVHLPDQTSVERCAYMLYIDLGELPEDGTLPPQPQPALAAALSGGLLPCLERIVRRTGEAFQAGTHTPPPSNDERLLGTMLASFSAESYLCWLLAYGSPTEAAGVVLSWGKLLRVAAAEALPAEAGTPRAHGDLAPNVFILAGNVLVAASPFVMQSNKRARGDEGDGGPVRQLRRMAALAACEWLPVMSGVVLEAARRLLAPGPQHQAQPSALLGDRWMKEVLFGCLNPCIVWLPTELGAAPRAGGAGPGATAAGVQGRLALQRLSREARTVQMVGASMQLSAHLLRGGAPWTLPAGQLLSLAYRLALYSPGEVRRAVEARRAAGIPTHCTWSSEVVAVLASKLPAARHIGPVEVLGLCLTVWERGEPTLPQPPGDDDDAGRGLLVTLRAEVEQPCPLRRCSWWRCTHLAGDSEAGVERSKCGGCGREWYCGRECQAAHWRAGHKAECGGKG